MSGNIRIIFRIRDFDQKSEIFNFKIFFWKISSDDLICFYEVTNEITIKFK